MDIRKILIICLIVLPLFILSLYRDIQHQQRMYVMIDRDMSGLIAALEKDPAVRQEYLSRAKRATKELDTLKVEKEQFRQQFNKALNE